MRRIGFRLESSRCLMLAVALVFWILANASLRQTFFQQTYRWVGQPNIGGVALGMTVDGIGRMLGDPIPCGPTSRRSTCMSSYRGEDGQRVDVFFTQGVATFVFGWSLYDGNVPVLRAGDSEQSMCHVLGPSDAPLLAPLLSQSHLLHFDYPGFSLTVNATRGFLATQARVSSFRLESSTSEY
jgi:hypothetical protein